MRVGFERKFLIYGGGLWGAILVKQLCALAMIQQREKDGLDAPAQAIKEKRLSPLQIFFSNLQGVMIHRDCILSTEFKEFISNLVDLVEQTQPPPENQGISDDSGSEEVVPASMCIIVNSPCSLLFSQHEF